ncbi:hypothetical protein N9E35_01465 [Candidatus Marinimicrobia bacterium]|nr:hypothetical protein [Candidatus Neomarinimicrobiota bacterium]
MKGYGSIRPIEQVFAELKNYCKKHDVDFVVAHEKLGKAIKAQARSTTGEEHFTEYWNHLLAKDMNPLPV